MLGSFEHSFSACYSFVRPVLCDWLTLLSSIHCKSVHFGGKPIAHLWHTHTAPLGSNPCLTRHNSVCVCVFVRVCFVFLTRQEVPSKMSFLIHRPSRLPQGLNTHTPPSDDCVCVCVCVCVASQGLTAADTAGERCYRHSLWKHTEKIANWKRAPFVTYTMYKSGSSIDLTSLCCVRRLL